MATIRLTGWREGYAQDFVDQAFLPDRAELSASLTLSLGIVLAGFVWWGLRSAQRVAWWTAFALAGAWSLNHERGRSELSLRVSSDGCSSERSRRPVARHDAVASLNEKHLA